MTMSNPDGTRGSERAMVDIAAMLTDIGSVAVAVSGGVDSMTLAHIAHDALGQRAEMFHARSPAVPREATERVQRHARAAGWILHVVDAGETSDGRYLENPVDRCFYCKTSLYGFISGATEHTIVSGTNLDDLGDFRPGLRAADDHDVRHPYVEAGVDKQAVRDIAHRLHLDDLAELPAAPCLASRIETGIRVTPKRLSTIDVVERFLRERTAADDIRCRVRATGLVIEIDAHLVERTRVELADDLRRLLSEMGIDATPEFEPYRRGSAFLNGTAS